MSSMAVEKLQTLCCKTRKNNHINDVSLHFTLFSQTIFSFKWDSTIGITRILEQLHSRTLRSLLVNHQLRSIKRSNVQMDGFVLPTRVTGSRLNCWDSLKLKESVSRSSRLCLWPIRSKSGIQFVLIPKKLTSLGLDSFDSLTMKRRSSCQDGRPRELSIQQKCKYIFMKSPPFCEHTFLKHSEIRLFETRICFRNWLIKPYKPLSNGWTQFANCAASYKSPASLESASYTFFYPCTYLLYSICERNSTIVNALQWTHLYFWHQLNPVNHKHFTNGLSLYRLTILILFTLPSLTPVIWTGFVYFKNKLATDILIFIFWLQNLFDLDSVPNKMSW